MIILTTHAALMSACCTHWPVYQWQPLVNLPGLVCN